jgi:hypothetical protein
MLTPNDIAEAFNRRISASVQLYDSVSPEALRARGGRVRGSKGSTVQWLAESCISAAWDALNGGVLELGLRRGSFTVGGVGVSGEYTAPVDIEVWVRGRCVAGVECKAYTDISMYKRVLVDFQLLKTVLPGVEAVLFQAESMLGGDYSTGGVVSATGSEVVRVLNSHFPQAGIRILTALPGERDSQKPIHTAAGRKLLTADRVQECVDEFSRILSAHV